MIARLRNPHGNGNEWKGDWSDGSSQWKDSTKNKVDLNIARNSFNSKTSYQNKYLKVHYNYGAKLMKSLLQLKLSHKHIELQEFCQ